MISAIGIRYGETELVKYAQTDQEFPKGTLLVVKD
ncbi:signal peptidase II, partial [Streptococcus pyogenes]